MKIIYTPTFVRMYKKLPTALQEEVKERIQLFREDHNHTFLKTHKLKGRLKNRQSFSVNYSYRIIFHLEKDTAFLLAVGDHSVYKS